MLQHMAIVAIGGLAIEVFAALFFMPCFYVLCTLKILQTADRLIGSVGAVGL